MPTVLLTSLQLANRYGMHNCTYGYSKEKCTLCQQVNGQGVVCRQRKNPRLHDHNLALCVFQLMKAERWRILDTY